MVSFEELYESFPWDQYPEMKPNQRQALEFIAGKIGNIIIQAPTGTGKTIIGKTFLQANINTGAGQGFYIVPTKTLVDQVHALHPDTHRMYGRHEYACLYYPDQTPPYRADEIPCLLLRECSHRVDQETGQPFVPGAALCPYYLARYQAKQADSGIVICTMAFYLFTHLFNREDERPAALVIDEAHNIAKVVRSALSFEISDYHLQRAVEVLDAIGSSETEGLDRFLQAMLRIVRERQPGTRTLLEEFEVQELVEQLEPIDAGEIRRALEQGLTSGEIDEISDREVLNQIYRLIFDLRRYLRSLHYAMEDEGRYPLNYVVSFWLEDEQMRERQRIQHKLIVEPYYVAPLVRRLLAADTTLAYSATIGNPQYFGYETGITGSYLSLGSDFPPTHTRIYVPTDTPRLNYSSRRHRDIGKAFRWIAQACRRFVDEGFRSLVVVVSEAERRRFLEYCQRHGVNAISYDDSVAPRGAAAEFKEGQGEVLVGTGANYAEGLDLPRGLAPVIFYLRPAYPFPEHPLVQFEQRRFGRNTARGLQQWRVTNDALQVRGRNIRSYDDLGVTFFVSTQFQEWLYPGLPDWLKPAYRGKFTFEECVEDALEVMRR